MKKIHLGLIIVISFGLLLSVGFGLLTMYVNQKELPKGVVLSGWQVGGKPADEVMSELDQRLQAMTALKVELQSDALKGHTESFTLREAGVQFNAADFQEAIAKLSEGSLWEQVLYRRNFQLEWHISMDWDRDLLKERLNEEWQKERFGEPVNAVRSISEDDVVRYTPEKTAYRIDWPAFYEGFSAVLPNESHFTELNPDEVITVQLPLIRQKPPVTVKSLQDEGIERKIVEFSTSLGSSGPGRVHNVTAAAKSVDGMILKPGDEFNYAHIIDTAKKEYGFEEAPVIVNGKLVPGIGGGICQVSSTVYHATLLIGLEITERRNHSLPVSYLPKGQDATFAEGAINFRFRNNTGKHLLILSEVSHGNLTLKMFGTFPENTEYELVSTTVETLPSSEKIIHNNSLPPGLKQVVQNGKPGYVVETYRTKKVNGKVVEKVKISKDTYRPQNSIVAINPTSEVQLPETNETPKEEVVEDGISAP
ncbi:VanW family protein [Paenibacillus sp. NPDC093718]|uniref:VanW family protein n=1 Tax=Paenibacillus sp. NPDC093718 TaxID=3390601 RepID=UPI003D08DC49